MVPFEAYWADAVRVENCEFTEFGVYNGPYSEWWEDSGIRMINAQNVELINNTFSGYGPNGLVSLYEVSNAIISGNDFEIEIHGLLYGVNATEIGFTADFAAIEFESCADVAIYQNEFGNNEVDYETPWMYLRYCDDTMCLSGNR